MYALSHWCEFPQEAPLHLNCYTPVAIRSNSAIDALNHSRRIG